jgi:Fur family peroxide stress response transcriptional regulator
MNCGNGKITAAQIKENTRWFTARCKENGLKVTPQRVAIYRELLSSDKHPSAEMLHESLRSEFPTISLDTVNRTLLKLSEIGAAFIVEGSGDARRFDASLDHHQHFRCIKCKRIIDFHYEPFDNVKLPAAIAEKFTVIRKTVYLEGICDLCK